MVWLGKRDRRPEVMDQPDLNPERHHRALAALSRVNFLSATAGSFFPRLQALQASLGTPQLRILDIACGGGDVAIRLAKRADRAGLDWRIAGCDISPVAIEHASGRAVQHGVSIHFFVHDLLRAPVAGCFDAVICSLFLHHLDEAQAIGLLRTLPRVCDEGPALILVNDLDRSVLGLGLAYLIPRLLTTSDVVHADATDSVRAAFTLAEALRLADQAGLHGAQIRRCWPFRWLLSWRRS
jgi:2-polyprenyl-3-methyl-5-hydroxy-6-metoxy-1,4-benzoquinol methylase